MIAPVFVDTNVLIYARDASEVVKQPLARHWLDNLWGSRSGRVSYQVLHEYYVSVTRKLRPGLPREEARAEVRDLQAWRPARMDEAMLEDAWWLESRYGLADWDALVVAAARALGCRYLLSEDFQAGQDIDGLLVVDPFTTEPDHIA